MEDLVEKEIEEESPLCKACRSGDLSLVDSLLGGLQQMEMKTLGALATTVRHDIKKKHGSFSLGGITPLTGLPKKTTMMQEINNLNPEGKSPLHLAAERGHLEIVNLLVDKKADVNVRGE